MLWQVTLALHDRNVVSMRCGNDGVVYPLCTRAAPYEYEFITSLPRKSLIIKKIHVTRVFLRDWDHVLSSNA